MAKGTVRDYVVQSKLKDAVQEAGMRLSSEAREAINVVVEEVIAKALKRAKENGRLTVQAQDL